VNATRRTTVSHGFASESFDTVDNETAAKLNDAHYIVVLMSKLTNLTSVLKLNDEE